SFALRLPGFERRHRRHQRQYQNARHIFHLSTPTPFFSEAQVQTADFRRARNYSPIQAAVVSTISLVIGGTGKDDMPPSSTSPKRLEAMTRWGAAALRPARELR